MEPEREEEAVEAVKPAVSGPARFPKFGTYEGLAPKHLSPFAIETNVSRIAQQITDGRTPTYD